MDARQEAREAVARVSRDLARHGLLIGTAGNVSTWFADAGCDERGRQRRRSHAARATTQHDEQGCNQRATTDSVDPADEARGRAERHDHDRGDLPVGRLDAHT
ncbi:MAG: hypothetical protein U0R23_10045 [Candidatus Nanopelagicales bacterium]